MPEEHTTQGAAEVTPTPAPTATPAPLQPRASWKQNAGIPFAIVIAAVLIAGAIVFDGNGGKFPVNVQANIQGGIDSAQNEQQTPEMDVAPVTKDDHIRGNPNAPIVIVEYSDYDCPFCKNFHNTMNQIMENFGKNGEVAWVYRHFPLEQLHPNAPKIAAASYCVSEQGGDEAFWEFSDLVFNEREINAQTDMSKLSDYAVQAGAEKGKFELCVNSGKYADKVKADVEAALKTGARGTPYSIVVIGDQKGVLNGAQPYETVEQIVTNLLEQMKGGG
jgi:protein-disulfide isomerase